MYINVTLLTTVDCSLLSGSAHELGNQAARITWENSLQLASDHPCITDDNRDAIRDYFASYGAWSRDEIAGWSDADLGALLYQEGASQMRELDEEAGGSWDRYYQLASEGRIRGGLSLVDREIMLHVGM